MKQAIFVPVLLVVLLLCGALDSYGQGKWPKRFYIGANHVRCDLQAVSSWPRYIYTTDSSWRTLGDSLRLKEGKFDQLGDLGINLAGCTVDPAHVLRVQFHQVVSELNLRSRRRSALMGKPELEYCIEDIPLRSAAAAERIMFHPEAGTDFSQIGTYATLNETIFNHHPIQEILTDRPLGSTQTTTSNCIELNSPGVVSGLSSSRKRELSMQQRYRRTPGTRIDTICGMYQLSIIMASPDIVSPDNEEAVLRVHIGSFSQPLHFDVPGSAFYNETHEPIQNTVIEYHLGFVELYLDSINGNCVWGVQDWTAQGLPLGDEDLMHETNPPEIAGIVVQNGVLDSFDIRLEYIQGTNGSIYVDAVCLSTPTAFALFNPDNPQVHPACAQYRSDMEQRLTSVLTDTYSNTPHEFVRMLYGAEQGLTTGAWRASRYFHQRLFTRTDSMVWLYTASSAWSTIAGSALETADLFRNAASGFYHFPIHWDIPQPQEPMTTYYNKLILEPNHSNLQFTIDQYRRYALARQESSNRDPWIPFIQNHSNIFRDDSVFWDHDPLREPTAAEVARSAVLRWPIVRTEL